MEEVQLQSMEFAETTTQQADIGGQGRRRSLVLHVLAIYIMATSNAIPENTAFIFPGLIALEGKSACQTMLRSPCSRTVVHCPTASVGITIRRSALRNRMSLSWGAETGRAWE
jgi:hypothetical protein